MVGKAFQLWQSIFVDLITVLSLAIGLAMDAFAVSLSIGTTRMTHRARPFFRLSFHFGLFQFLMPILGWFAGTTVAALIVRFDHWIAFGLLGFVGGRMIQAGWNPEKQSFPSDPSKGKTLVMLSLATSIDAFSIGLTLAMVGIDILYPSVVIGIVTAVLSLSGLLAGHRLGVSFGKKMEILGGAILLFIGLRILLAHLMGS
jgi:manganese efflux pump family protein